MTNSETVFDAIDRDPKPKAEAAPAVVGEGWRIVPDVDLVAYFAGDLTPEPAISNSHISVLLAETPLDMAYKHPRLNPDYARDRAKETAALRRGDVVHQLALGKGRGFAVGDFKDWRTNAAKAFKEAAEADGLTPVLADKFEEAQVMADVIKAKVDRLLDGAPYETEVAIIWQEETPHGPIWVTGLMDIWCEERGIILDPKITGQLYDALVGRQMVNMGWDRQLALYERGVGMILPKLAGRVRAADLMIKPDAPFTSRLATPERAWRYSSVKQCQMAFETFARCLYAGDWPGFGDEVHTIECPPWEAKRREAAELEA